MHFWSKLGNIDFIWWWLIARTNPHAQNGVNFDFKVWFDFECQGQLRQKTIGLLNKVFYISGTDLVILAWTVDEISLGQAHDRQTHRHTHTQATTIPEGQNWPRVKIIRWQCWWHWWQGWGWNENAYVQEKMTDLVRWNTEVSNTIHVLHIPSNSCLFHNGAYSGLIVERKLSNILDIS